MDKKRIMVVEDEITIALEIECKIKDLGYEVVDVVSSGEKAVKRISELRPDLVLMDIKLKGEMDGIQTAAQVSTFDIPVIFLTAYSDNETFQRAKQIDAFGYIVKPFEEKQIRNTIEIALYKHEINRKLKESEARYRCVSELISDIAFACLVSENNEILCEWVTGAIQFITGYSDQELKSCGGWDVVAHPEDVEIVREHYRKLLEGTSDSCEFRILTKNKEIRWLHAYGKPIGDEKSNKVIRIVGAVQDITERNITREALQQAHDELEKRVQKRTRELEKSNQKLQKEIAERKKAEKKLLQSERKYRNLVENLHEGIWAIDENAYTTFVNKRMAEMLGYSTQEMQGKSLFDFVDKKLFQRTKENLERRKKGVKEQTEQEFIRKDGIRLYALLETSPLFDEKGTYSGAIAGVQDITTRKQIQQEKEDLQKRLAEAEKHSTIGQFTSTIAHELNNNLDILVTKLFLLSKSLEGYDSNSECWKIIGKIKKQLFRMSHLAPNILEYVKPRSVIFGKVNINDVLYQVIDLFSDEIEKGAEINVTIDPSLPQIEGDRIGLEIVFKNIILNALESQKKNINIDVETRKLKNKQVELVVKDHGKGIPKKDMDQVFEAFYTTKRKTGGTGLGLSMSKMIIDEHQGSIVISSEDRKGTQVSIRLPEYQKRDI